VIDIDEMGPESAKSHPGKRLVPVIEMTAHGPQQPRAQQEIDYGRRGKGYIFGALQAATGEVFTEPYRGRTIANFVDFLEKVERWVAADYERVYVILDNLSTHRAKDVLLFSLAYPRWEFVFQPKYAAYLNLIEPWWKILRSLALKGRRFETWNEVSEAVAAATAYWNAHRHPFRWGRKRRRRIPRTCGVAALPLVA
jgi:transposase